LSLDADMRARLAVLEPGLIEIEDESGLHVGHAGAKEGGHYRLTVVSARFSGQSRVARHRTVYQALGPLMQNGIHALALQTLAPDEQ
jgi:BolA family transcriptional regulator, general stress-responsive regulator